MRPALYEWWQTFFRLGQTQGMATPPKHNFSPQKGWLPPKEGTPHPQRFFKRVLKLYSQIKSVYNRIYNSWSNAQFKQIHVACPRVFPGLGVARLFLLVIPGSTYRNSCSFVLCEPDGWGLGPRTALQIHSLLFVSICHCVDPIISVWGSLGQI